MQDLKTCITAAFEKRAEITPQNASPEIREAVEESLRLLTCGELRVANPTETGWETEVWLKQAVLLSFRLFDNTVIDAGFTKFYDKVPLAYRDYDAAAFHADGVRVAPHAIVRHGAYVGSNTVLMPSYVNIGAYIGTGCMIDTWATVGSCAQIGNNVHLSGGAGIGGVLEPLQAQPTIIEDDCFIGARAEIVEGVIVEKGAVISMGIFIGQSTRIYHRETGEISFGRVPAGSVVVPGNLPAKDGSHSLYCAVIVKQVNAKTRDKTALNELLRNMS